MLSSHAKFIELTNGKYAVFNNLLMDVIYINETEKKDILNFSITDKSTLELLYDKGIYYRDPNSDKKAIECLRNSFTQSLGRFQILYLILTNSCNLNCKYCFLENNPNYNEHRTTMLETTALLTAKKYCDYANNNGIESPLIVLYGGEPLLNFKTIKIVVNYIKGRINNPQFSLITNGTLLTDEICDYLKENNVNIGISIDGIKQIHDENRPFRKDGSGSFDEVIQGIALLEKKGNDYGLSMTVSQDFLEHQDEVLKWLSENKIKNVFFNTFHFSSKDSSWKDIAEKTVAFLTRCYDTFEKSNFSDGRIQRQLDSVIKNKFLFSDCGAIGCEQFVVMPNGDVSICHGDSNTGKHIVGNIQRIDLEDIIKTDEGCAWKKRATIFKTECLSCEALFCCGGGCSLQAQNLFGNRNEIDRFHCIYVKGVLKWILEKAALKD